MHPLLTAQLHHADWGTHPFIHRSMSISRESAASSVSFVHSSAVTSRPRRNSASIVKAWAHSSALGVKLPGYGSRAAGFWSRFKNCAEHGRGGMQEASLPAAQSRDGRCSSPSRCLSLGCRSLLCLVQPLPLLLPHALLLLLLHLLCLPPHPPSSSAPLSGPL